MLNMKISSDQFECFWKFSQLQVHRLYLPTEFVICPCLLLFYESHSWALYPNGKCVVFTVCENYSEQPKISVNPAYVRQIKQMHKN